MKPRITFTGLTLSGLALVLALPMAAQAHRAWILPASTALSSDDPWVTFDAAVSNDIFHTDYVPLRIDDLQVKTPTGADAEPQHVNVGKHRTTFDLQLAERGTYRVFTASHGMFASWTDSSGERKRWRGSRDAFSAEVPANASQLQVTESARRIETFVTAGAPTNNFKPSGRGLELIPVTHPNDLFAGEKARFRFLIDGQPAPGVEVEVVPGGMRYRNQQDAMSATTDTHGEVSFTWPAAGMYWLSAEHEDDKASMANATRRASYAVTLEVLPQ